MVIFFGGEVIIVIAVIIFLIVALMTTGLVGMCNWALDCPDILATRIFLLFLVLSFLTALTASDNHSNKSGIKRFLHCLFISVPSSAGITAGLLYCIYLICGYVTSSSWDAMAVFLFIVPLIQILFIIFLCFIALAIGALLGVAPAFGIDDVSTGVFQSFGLSALASVIPFGLIALFTYLVSNDMFKIFFLVQY